MAVRAELVMAVPHYAQGFGAERARSRPLRAAFRAFMKQRLRPAERLSHVLQIENETAGGVAANKIVFHGQGLLCGANLGPMRRYMSIMLITSVVLRRGFLNVGVPGRRLRKPLRNTTDVISIIDMYRRIG